MRTRPLLIRVMILTAVLAGCRREQSTPTGESGYLEGVSKTEIIGWAWDKSRPDVALEVEILDGRSVVGKVLADGFREDLKAAGIGNGRHQFIFTIPESLKDGKRHSIRARVAGGRDLQNGPMSLQVRRR